MAHDLAKQVVVLRYIGADDELGVVSTVYVDSMPLICSYHNRCPCEDLSRHNVGNLYAHANNPGLRSGNPLLGTAPYLGEVCKP
jgi:hypothetical protein